MSVHRLTDDVSKSYTYSGWRTHIVDGRIILFIRINMLLCRY